MIHGDAEVKEAVRQLKELRRSAMPYTVRNTLNDLAFATRARAQKQIAKTFTLRNKFTASRVAVDKARARKIEDMEAAAGHTKFYMKHQEQGGYSKANGLTHPIATVKARVGKNAERLVRRVLWMRKINVGKGSKFFVGAPFGTLGLFMKMARNRIAMLYNLSHSRVKIPKQSWLEPARDSVATNLRVNRVFLKNAKKALKRFTKT